MPTHRRRIRSPRIWPLGLIVALLLAGGAWYAISAFRPATSPPAPIPDNCVAIVNGNTTVITLEQAAMAAIISGEARRRGLVPRAVSIALATAYQESGIRNIDYGDRDSLGLFQQRPSQGWGTPEQILDPWYSAGRFYAALVKIPNWSTGDINDVAQQVQISAFPDAYRVHETNARTLASALTGETPVALACRIATAVPSDIGAAEQLLRKAFGDGLSLNPGEMSLNISGQRKDVLAAVALSVASASTTGLSSASIGDSVWDRSQTSWQGSAPNEPRISATLTFTN